MPGEKAGLLSAKDYDNDAHSTDSAPHSDSDDDGSIDGRNSRELADQDRELLREETEREELLGRGNNGGRLQKWFRSGRDAAGAADFSHQEKRRLRREARDGRRQRRRQHLEEHSELVYEMEEGGPSEASSTSGPSRHSSESDLQRLVGAQAGKTGRRKRILKRFGIHTAIGVLFLLFLFGAYKASRSTKSRTKLMFSNGTSNFAPTTILISLDGFRADFLQRGLTPTLNSFIENGISPLYMLPSFPSVTFPNHYTMATGLYPESHGIVGNTFWDVDLKEEFYYTHPDAMQDKWWGGEPMWVSAEKQGIRTAVHMWPGSEAHIGAIEPAHLDKYNGTEVLQVKVDRILELLDLPGPDSPIVLADSPRPQLVAAYVPDVDADGHKYGPNSTEIRQTIAGVDAMLASLIDGLTKRNLTDIVNVIVVSDHGMATTSNMRLIQLEDLVDTNLIEHTDGWPLYGLRPKNPEDLDMLYQQLKEKSKTNPNIEVYLRDKDMPERYHFSNNQRIAPLWIVPKTGWAIVTKDEFDVQKGRQEGLVYHPRGLHGYDFEHPLMRAIFVARGPAFPHKPGSRVEVFQNTELYNIVCDSIGVEPAPNNGTLHLPLKPIGLHSDHQAPTIETPPDPPAPESEGKQTSALIIVPVGTSAAVGIASTVVVSMPTAVAPVGPPKSPESPERPEKPEAPVPPEKPTGPEKSEDHGTGTEHQGNKGKLKGWWAALISKIDEAKDWAKGIFSGNKLKKPPVGEETPPETPSKEQV